MTLLELCDELHATLIIKRLPIKVTGGEVRYSVNIQSARLYTTPNCDSWAPHKVARVIDPDVNVALNKLCNTITGNYIQYRYNNEVYVEKVERGNFSILGVW